QIALQNLINAAGPYPGVVSVSYGEPESVGGAGLNAVFYATYQQAAAQGISVFGASGDNGASGFGPYSNIQVDTLGISGWTETPYNVSVGGTDFEDTYNSKEGGPALSTYWNATNTASYGSAISYIPEMPWDNSCANAMIARIINGSVDGFLGYGATGACNETTSNTFYEDTGAGGGGPSNCAAGTGGVNESNDFATGVDCQGYAKPSWQSAYGVPSDGLRDTPDVSLFAANGDWGHYQVICWSDPSYTSDGSASCSGAPSTWTGFGGTSVATPAMAGIQALVNQKTGTSWGNPNPIYYQIAQNEYGTQGGTFVGSSCNSSASGGPASSCVFNDVTQGDIVENCYPDISNSFRNFCYGYVAGVDLFSGATSTDAVSGITVVNGGKGYTTATLPTCAIAGPSNAAAYKAPSYPTATAGNNIYAGGTHATCSVTSAQINSGSTSAVWTVRVSQSPNGCGYDSVDGLCDTANAWPVWGNGQVSVVVAGTTYTFVTALTGTTPNEVLEYTSSTGIVSVGGAAYSTNALNTSKNLYAAITNTASNCAASPCFLNVSAANANATAAYSSSGSTNGNITLTSRTAGYAGNFSVNWGPDDAETEIIQITQTTAGQ